MSLNMTAVVWDELVSSPADSSQEVSYNFTTDPLLVSCTLHRLITESRANDKVDYLNWSLTNHMDKIINLITDQDRVFAEVVRSYYKSKLVISKLRGDHFSEYKNALLKYLTDSPFSITERSVGMIYRLPYFYQYDMQLIEIFDGEYVDLEKAPNHLERQDIKLSFISKVDNGQKRARHYEYWFKDENNLRILVEVEKHNPVRNLWEKTIQSDELNINAVFEKKRKGNLEFYVARGWTINV